MTEQPNWEKLARACRRYLNAYNDPIADDVALGSVGNDLRIVANREIRTGERQPQPRVFFPGETVPAGVVVMDGHGKRFGPHDADWTYYALIGGGPAITVSIPTESEWQAAVARARAEREGSQP